MTDLFTFRTDSGAARIRVLGKNLPNSGDRFVAVYLSGERGGSKGDVTMSPTTAREMAAALLKAADKAEEERPLITSHPFSIHSHHPWCRLCKQPVECHATKEESR